MLYFVDCNTVSEVKVKYRELAMQFHLDRGGDHDIMVEVNNAYHLALAELNGSSEKGSDDQWHTYYYNHQREQAAMDVVSKLLALAMDKVDVWMIGSWIWVRGESLPYKDQIKALGLRWHGERKVWYWKPISKARTRYNRKVDLTHLASWYGAEKFEEENDPAAVAVAR